MRIVFTIIFYIFCYTIFSQDISLINWLGKYPKDTIVERDSDFIVSYEYNLNHHQCERIIVSGDNYKCIKKLFLKFKVEYIKVKDTVFLIGFSRYYTDTNRYHYVKYRYVQNKKNGEFLSYSENDTSYTTFKNDSILSFFHIRYEKTNYNLIKCTSSRRFLNENNYFYERRENNILKQTSFFLNGKLEGLSFIYNEDGDIQIILEYENNKIKNGVYNFYYKGQLLRKDEYKDGILIKKHWNENFVD